MQSQYGVPEIQQFMADGGCSPVFSIGTADMQDSSQSQKQQHHDHGLHLHQHQSSQHQQQHQLHHHQHVHLHHHHLPQMQLQHPIPLPSPQAAFPHFHPIPVTQQLFQHVPQFHLFQQEQQRRIHQQLVHLGLEADSGPENSSSPTRIIPSTPAGGGGIPPFLGGPSFKLAVSEGGGGGGGGGDCSSRDRLNDEDGILQGDEGSETHIHPWAVATEEEHGIKEPFWRPLDVDYINRNNKRCKEKQPEEHGHHVGVKHCKDGENVDDGNHSSSNYKLFSELEAIYKPVGVGDVMIIAGGCGAGRLNCNQQTGSGSALTGENPPATAVVPRDDWENVGEDADQGSYTSAGEEAAQQTTRDKPSNKSSGGSSAGRRKRKRKRKQQMSSVAAFLEALVKRLMEHQEGLHRQFMEVLDRRDQERTNRDETWRQQEADKARREARARAQEQALASSREAAIITFLEKITGESLNLPTREQFQSQLLPLEENEEEAAAAAAAAAKNINVGDQQPNCYAVDGSDDADVGSQNAGNIVGDVAINANPSRWPKAEVQALIRVRSNLETRFQEPGLKGPLWEEVSSTMAALGYRRSAKRCKEKWENINKYFRKTKDSPNKRSQNSKTCPYFHQLDQLYSRSLNSKGAAPPPSAGRRDSSELLDAVVVPHEQAAGCFTFPGMEPAAPARPGMRGGHHRTGAGGDSDGPEREVDGDEAEDEEEGEEGDSQDHHSRGRGDLRDDGHFSP